MYNKKMFNLTVDWLLMNVLTSLGAGHTGPERVNWYYPGWIMTVVIFFYGKPS
jgi:hypothetical protein